MCKCLRCGNEGIAGVFRVLAFEHDPHPVFSWLCAACVKVCRAGRAIVERAAG